MNKSQMDSLLAPLNGATFVGLDTVTVVALKGGKANTFQGRLKKHVTGSRVMVFSKGGQDGGYGRMVNRRLVKEGCGPYEVKKRAWGERCQGTPYVEHKGEYYLEVIFQSAGDVHYTLDDKPCDKPYEVQGFPEADIVVPGHSGQGGLVDTVVLRTYKLESVVAMRAFGQVEVAG